MIPTIREGNFYTAGDLLIVDKITPKFFGYKKGDIVLAKSPVKLNSLLCKRVIAVENESACVDGVYYHVPQGYIWIEGDNKDHSFDSRNFGPVPLELLEGKIFMKLWNKPTFY